MQFNPIFLLFYFTATNKIAKVWALLKCFLIFFPIEMLETTVMIDSSCWFVFFRCRIQE
jgi:hypothetical protein